MDLLYETMNNLSNAHRQHRDQVARLYVSLRNLGYRNPLPDPSHRPQTSAIWHIFGFLAHEITGSPLLGYAGDAAWDSRGATPRVGPALEAAGYPQRAQLAGREHESMDRLWPDLLDALGHMASILDITVTQKEYKDEFPKLGAMQIDAIICEFQARGDKSKRQVIRSNFDKKLEEYAIQISGAIDDTTQDIEALETDLYHKQREPELRVKIQQQSEALQLDKHHIEVYMEKATANLASVKTQLDECEEALSRALDDQADVNVERTKLDSILERHGKNFSDLIRETNLLMMAQADLAEIHEATKQEKSRGESMRQELSKQSYPLETKLRELNRKYETQLPAELTWDAVPDLTVFSSVEEEFKTKSQRLGLEILSIKTQGAEIERELDTMARTTETQRAKQHRLDKEFENRTKDLELVSRTGDTPEEKRYLAVQSRLETKRSEHDAAAQDRRTAVKDFEAARSKARELDERVSGHLKPLYDRVDAKQNQLREVYATMSLSVSSLQSYVKDYVEVCESVTKRAGDFSVKRPASVRLSAIDLLDRVKRARSGEEN